MYRLPAIIALLIGLIALLGKLASAQAGPVIPDEAIRIRIIANSDSDFDQAVKRHVRDEVNAKIASWGSLPSDYDGARSFLAKRLPVIRETAMDALKPYHVSYGAVVELGEVPFPEKTFAGREYAAGDYEALRITLLTAATADDKTAADDVVRTSAENSPASKAADWTDGPEQPPEAKFFLWEALQKLFGFLKSLFS
jgi:stage II sporulation protein R